MTQSNADSDIRHVDAVIIGAGTAGHNAYRQISKVTDNLVIINEGIWSTTCTTMGCMPSKLLIAAAERAYHADHSDEFGIEGVAKIDGKQVMQRVRRERDHFASYPLKNAESWAEKNKIYGRAVFTDSGLIEAHTSTGATKYIKADYIIIATGSKPYVPEGWKERLSDALLTSDIVFEIPDLPKSMAVIGSGAIGLELAQAFSRLGVKVAIFNRSKRVGGLRDETVNDKAIECLSSQLDLRLGTTINDVERHSYGNGNAVIHYQDLDGASHTWHGEKVLVAAGRRNTIDTLGLQHLGVQLDDKNRPKNMDKTTGKISGTKSGTDVYIVGDANAYMPLLHVTSNEGYLAGKEVGLLISKKQATSETMSEAIAVDPDCTEDTTILNDITPEKATKPATAMSIIFSDPQIMNVGKSKSDIEKQGISYVIGEVSFDNQGRSRIMGVNCGILRIYASSETSQILGACMVGPDAEYIAHILATAITNEVTVDGLLSSPFYHPTILEGLRTALRDTRSKITDSRS